MNLTIIPDVHGRPFWRDAVKDVADTPAVFLGDYLDPYPQDMVTWEDALQGLHDIIELKKRYPEQVTLLLGNHDVHYFESYPFFSRGGRMSHERFEEIRSIFMENLDLFDLAKCISCGKGLPYLFTHAGVRTRWIEANVRYIERNRVDVDKEAASGPTSVISQDGMLTRHWKDAGRYAAIRGKIPSSYSGSQEKRCIR